MVLRPKTRESRSSPGLPRGEASRYPFFTMLLKSRRSPATAFVVSEAWGARAARMARASRPVRLQWSARGRRVLIAAWIERGHCLSAHNSPMKSPAMQRQWRSVAGFHDPAASRPGWSRRAARQCSRSGLGEEQRRLAEAAMGRAPVLRRKDTIAFRRTPSGCPGGDRRVNMPTASSGGNARERVGAGLGGDGRPCLVRHHRLGRWMAGREQVHRRRAGAQVRADPEPARAPAVR